MLATYELGAAASASPAFDTSGRHGYVACLDGSVHCLIMRRSGAAAAGRLTLALAWRREAGGPVFSDPAVRPDGALLVAAVDGTVTALSSAGAWRRSVGAMLFISYGAWAIRWHPSDSQRLCSADPPRPMLAWP